MGEKAFKIVKPNLRRIEIIFYNAGQGSSERKIQSRGPRFQHMAVPTNIEKFGCSFRVRKIKRVWK